MVARFIERMFPSPGGGCRPAVMEYGITNPTGRTQMDLKLEVVPIPVSDVDAAKAFYTEQVGFNLDHDAVPTSTCGSSR